MRERERERERSKVVGIVEENSWLQYLSLTLLVLFFFFWENEIRNDYLFIYIMGCINYEYK